MAFAYTVWTIYGSGAETVMWGFILVLIAIPFYIYNYHKNIQENKLRSFNTQFLNHMLIINEQLENDILTIDEGIDHLDKHEVFMNYDALLETIKEKNQQVRERINEIDSKFAEMYDELNTMYANRKTKQEKEEEKKKDEENIEKPIEDKDNEDSIIENN